MKISTAVIITVASLARYFFIGFTSFYPLDEGKRKKVPLPLPTCVTTVTVRDAIYDLAYLNSNEGDFEQNYKNIANNNIFR